MNEEPHHDRLSEDQLAHYRREGYLVYDEPVLPESEFEALRAHFEKKLAAWPADQRPEAMDTPHFEDPELFRWALAPEVLDLVEPVLGPDIILFSTHFICKPTGDGRRVPWHEDSAYWKGKLDPMEVCTVWLAIDPSTTANGCMHVIPRTHDTGRMGFSDYDDVDTSKNVFPTEITPAQRRDELAVPIELQPNQCSLHDARLMHGSPPNTSSIRRCGWTLRFCPAHVKLSPEVRDVHPIYQARGRNLADQPLADPTRAYREIAEQRRQNNIRMH
ncbi:MAG: phytanoyl-CoA dioxygenase family protein [Phycisphaeraceae bacterium]